MLVFMVQLEWACAWTVCLEPKDGNKARSEHRERTGAIEVIRYPGDAKEGGEMATPRGRMGQNYFRWLL